MDWKHIDKQPGPSFLPARMASGDVQARLLELLFGEKAEDAQSESYVRSEWKSLVGAAAARSTPLRLDGGMLVVRCTSASAKQDIQLGLPKLKKVLREQTGYELKGIRFDAAPQQADSQKTADKLSASVDKEKDEDSISAFVTDIRRILGLR